MTQAAARGLDPSELDRLLALATDVAVEAGTMVADRRKRAAVEVAATKSSPTDIVTASDTAAESLIRERIRAVRPDDGFLGEEGGGVVGSTGVTWVVDPIDGTVNYLYAIPAYAVSIGVQVAGVTVVGVVHNPVVAETCTAVQGRGARCNGRPLTVRHETRLEQALVATGFSYDADMRARQAGAVARLLPRVRDLRRFGAASLDLCAVAMGRVDAYLEQGLAPWDLAAGNLIATEAGAQVGGLHGEPAGERFVVAASPSLFPALHDLAVTCFG